MDFDENVENVDGEGGEDGEGGFEDLFAGGDETADGKDAYKSLKDAVIFVVDCRRHLFQKEANEAKSQFEVVMNAVSSFMKAKIITNDNDKIALILYNVKKAKNGMNFGGINTVFSLDSPDAERIKTVTDITKNFEAEYGFADQETPLHEALWLCNHEFKSQDKSVIKRIFLFTPEDLPNPTKKADRDLAFQHAKHLTEMNINIELFPLKKVNNFKFDVKKFYADLIAFDQDEVNTGIFDTSSKIMQLTQRIKQKEFKKRTLSRLEFALAPNLKIGMKVYTMIRATSRPYGVGLDAKTNKPLKTKSSYLCEETGAILEPKDIGTHFELGGEKVFFKKNDVNEIKKFDEPSMKLMGFKPRSRVKAYHNIRSSYFLYPDDERVSGSSQVVDAMIKQMIAKDKIAIVRFVPRATSAVRFCALFPQKESFDEDNFQTPPGFNLIFLPYADDIRKPDTIKPVRKVEVSRENVVNAKVLVKSLSIDFDSRNFTNPNIQNFFTKLQAIALGEDEPEDVEDLLEPDEEGFQKYQPFIDSFKNSIWGDDYNEPVVKKPASRGRAKKDDDDEDVAPAGKKGRGRGKVDIITEEDEPRGGRGKKGAAGKRGKKKGSDDESDGGDDYDFQDSFIEDDRPKSKRGAKKMDVEEEADTADITKEVESKLKQGEIKKLTVVMLKDYLSSKGLSTTGKKDDLVDRALNHLSNKK